MYPLKQTSLEAAIRARVNRHSPACQLGSILRLDGPPKPKPKLVLDPVLAGLVSY